MRNASPASRALITRTVATLVVALVLLAAPVSAWADAAVRLHATAKTIWTSSSAGLIELDARTGQVLRHPDLGGDYAAQVATTPGSAWVARVSDGYLAGALTRVDLRSGRQTTGLRVSGGTVFEVAAASGSVWAVVGRTSAPRIVRVAPRTGRRQATIATAGEPETIAADSSGLWIAASDGRLLHVRGSATRAQTVLAPAAGALLAPSLLALSPGNVFLTQGRTLLRVDKRSGRIAGRLRLPGLPDALAVGEDSVWVVGSRPPSARWLLKANARLRVEGTTAHVPFESTSLAVGSRVWLGVAASTPRIFVVGSKDFRLRRFATLP